MSVPNRHKMVLLTWVVVYPLITILLWGLEPFVGGLPLPIRTLLATAIFVPVMSYWVMPQAIVRLRFWLEA